MVEPSTRCGDFSVRTMTAAVPRRATTAATTMCEDFNYSYQAELAVRVGSFGEETAEIPNVSTPYILAPGQFFSPAVASGGWHLFPSGIDIELTGFDREPDPGPVRASAHPRRAQPT